MAKSYNFSKASDRKKFEKHLTELVIKKAEQIIKEKDANIFHTLEFDTLFPTSPSLPNRFNTTGADF